MKNKKIYIAVMPVIISILLFGIDAFFVKEPNLRFFAYANWALTILIYAIVYWNKLNAVYLGLLSWLPYSAWTEEVKKEKIEHLVGIGAIIVLSVVAIVHSLVFNHELAAAGSIIFTWVILTGLLAFYVVIALFVTFIRQFVLVYYVFAAPSDLLIKNASMHKFFSWDSDHSLDDIHISWVVKILMWRGSASDMLKLWDAFNDEFLQYGSKKFFLKLEEKMKKEDYKSIVFYVGRTKLLKFLRYAIGVSIEKQEKFGFVKDEYFKTIQNIFDMWIDFMVSDKFSMMVKVFNPVARDIYFQLPGLLITSKSKSVNAIYDVLKADQRKLFDNMQGDFEKLKELKYEKEKAYVNAVSLYKRWQLNYLDVSLQDIKEVGSVLKNTRSRLEKGYNKKAKKAEIAEQVSKALSVDPFCYHKKKHVPLDIEELSEIVNENLISFFEHFDVSVLVQYDNKKSKYVYEVECLSEMLMYMFDFLKRSKDLVLIDLVTDHIIQIHFNLWSYKFKKLSLMLADVWSAWSTLDRILAMSLIAKISNQSDLN